MIWEYLTHVIDTRGFWAARGRIDQPALNRLLGDFGRNRWELVSATPLSDGNVGTATLLLLFKRPQAG